MSSSIHPYIGNQYTFEDNRSIKIIDVKLRDRNTVEWWVTYEVKFSISGIPKRLSLTEREFISSFGHLFFQNPKTV